MSYEDDMEVLDGIQGKQERKNLRTILNRGRMDKFELDQFMHGDY